MKPASVLTMAMIISVVFASCASPTEDVVVVQDYNYVGHAETYGVLKEGHCYQVTAHWARPTDSTRVFIGPGYAAWDHHKGQLDTVPFVHRDSTWYFGSPCDDVLWSSGLVETSDSVVFYIPNVDVGEAYYLRKR